MQKKKQGNRSHVLWRYFLITFCIFLFAGAITYKLFSTTIIDADKWNAKALAELSRVDTIMPERGEILADDGSVLATNLRFYTLRLDYRSERFKSDRLMLSVDSLADSLAKYVERPHRTPQEWKSALIAPLKKNKDKWPRALLLARDVSYVDMEHIRTFPYLNMRNRNKSGLTIESRNRRRNPYGDMARRSIGIVSEDTEGHYRGYSGLEKALDEYLYGVPGCAKKIPLTHKISNWVDVPAKCGYDITTTININMQDLLENELNDILEAKNAEWGVAVLMEVATGDIKAISNLDKDPKTGRYIEGMNRAVLGFEPGSVVKTLSMLIALEDSLPIVRNLNHAIPTGHSWSYAKSRITDSHGYASIAVNEVLEKSSNIAMAKIITSEYGSHPGDYYDRVARLGFFNPLNTGIAGECVPKFPTRDKMSLVNLSRVSYGYATEIPPIYTLALYNAIANNGVFVRPRLVQKFSRDGVDSIVPVSYVNASGRICSERNAKILQDMLLRVVEGEHGTGRRLKNEFVKIAGKTGTSYMVDEHGYDPSKKRLTFCGFFPADRPMYSCVVLVCNPQCDPPKGAAATAGTVLKNIAVKMYSRGMLDNYSDYRQDPKGDGRPILFATNASDRYAHLLERLGIRSNYGQIGLSKVDNGGKRLTPSLRGLGLREAVAIIERNGCEVAFNGSGHVSAQTPAPGEPLPANRKIYLTLTNNTK